MSPHKDFIVVARELNYALESGLFRQPGGWPSDAEELEPLLRDIDEENEHLHNMPRQEMINYIAAWLEMEEAYARIKGGYHMDPHKLWFYMNVTSTDADGVQHSDGTGPGPSGPGSSRSTDVDVSVLKAAREMHATTNAPVQLEIILTGEDGTIEPTVAAYVQIID